MIWQIARVERKHVNLPINVGIDVRCIAVVKMVKEQVHIPVHVLIRPRSGNFVFSCTELKVMIEDIKMVGQLGVQGVAIGVLTEDNKINVDQEDAGLAGALWSV
jgi:copper homeostasis protein